MPFKVTGMTATGEIQVECDRATEAVVELGKMQSSGRAINCVVRHPNGRLISDSDLVMLAGTEDENA